MSACPALTKAGVLPVPDGDRTGDYRAATAQVFDVPPQAPPLRHADLAIALIDEAIAPRRHRTLLAVGY